LSKVVLDTNILLVCVSTHSRLHWIFKYLVQKKYQLFVTTEILKQVKFPAVNVINTDQFKIV